MKRFAIYARYSTDLQSEASTADQIRMCQAYIDREDGLLISTFQDQAASGASRFRTDYQRLLDEVRLHQAILWIQFDGMTPDQVCRRLNFSDSTNFRRAFKRWSGLTPSACHKILQALSGH